MRQQLINRPWQAIKASARHVYGMVDIALQSNSVLQHTGWPPAPVTEWTLHKTLASIWMAHPTEEHPRLVAAAMQEYYDVDRLEKLRLDWRANPYLASRLHVLEQALDGHGLGLHYLTVPVLYAQTEGLVAKAFNHRGEFHGTHMRQYLESLTTSTVGWPTDETAFESLNRVRRKFVFGNALPAEENRHAIMHGAALQYGTVGNSLRAILMVDYLQRTMLLGRLIQNGVVHSPGCPDIRSGKVESTFHRGVEALFLQLGERYQRCPTCYPSRDHHDERDDADAIDVQVVRKPATDEFRN